jgi:uncharacterized membrane protein
MALCPHCQTAVPEDAVTCPNCGQPLTVAEAFPSVQSTQPAGASPLADHLKAGWALFKQYPGGFIGFMLVCFIISAALNSIPWLGWLVSLLITSPLLMGNFIVAAKLLQRQPVEFQDFFSGFHFLLPLVLVWVVSWILVSLGFILLIIPGVYLAVAFLFAPYLVIDRGLDFWQALDISRRTVHPMWFEIFVLVLVLLLLNLAGAMVLGVGLLVSVPLTFCIVTVAYAKIFGFRSDYGGKIPRLM